MSTTIRKELITSIAKMKQFIGRNSHGISLSPNHFLVLLTIDEYGLIKDGYKYLNYSILTKLLKMSSPALAKMTKKMENLNLIEKQISDIDHRSKYIIITVHGMNLLERERKVAYKLPDKLYSKLGKKDSERLVKLLNEVTSIIDKLDYNN